MQPSAQEGSRERRPDAGMEDGHATAVELDAVHGVHAVGGFQLRIGASASVGTGITAGV
jgi:hypothetical protein